MNEVNTFERRKLLKEWMEEIFEICRERKIESFQERDPGEIFSTIRSYIEEGLEPLPTSPGVLIRKEEIRESLLHISALAVLGLQTLEANKDETLKILPKTIFPHVFTGDYSDQNFTQWAQAEIEKLDTNNPEILHLFFKEPIQFIFEDNRLVITLLEEKHLDTFDDLTNMAEAIYENYGIVVELISNTPDISKVKLSTDGP